METEQVKERLRLIWPMPDERLNELKPLLLEAIAYVRRLLRTEADETDSRAVGLAAAYCACQLSCTEEGSALHSFTAGDVKITAGDKKADMEQLFQLTLEGAADLLADRDFEFWAVP